MNSLFITLAVLVRASTSAPQDYSQHPFLWMDDGYGGMIYVPNPDYKEQQKLGSFIKTIFIHIRLHEDANNHNWFLSETCDKGYTCRITCFIDPVDAKLRREIEGGKCGLGNICCKDVEERVKARSDKDHSQHPNIWMDDGYGGMVWVPNPNYKGASVTTTTTTSTTTTNRPSIDNDIPHDFGLCSDYAKDGFECVSERLCGHDGDLITDGSAGSLFSVRRGEFDDSLGYLGKCPGEQVCCRDPHYFARKFGRGRGRG